MSTKNQDKLEKIADIVAEMRECDGYRAYYDGGLHHESGEESVVNVDCLHDFADRIDAAWKREYDFPKSQSVDADKRTGKDINGVIEDLLKSSKYYYHRGDLVQGQFCRVTADRIREVWKREYSILKKCGIITRLFDTLEEAAASWNRRDGKAIAKGKWKNGTDYEYEFAYCSECGRMQWAGWDSHQEAKEKVGNFHKEYKFCPGCGAKMEGGCYVK